ncbi:MAG: hypothetical protein JJU13_10740 [Balneolaceae bacterium]|nr:hypothetical protein [Balneolaceae bacterium]
MKKVMNRIWEIITFPFRFLIRLLFGWMRPVRPEEPIDEGPVPENTFVVHGRVLRANGHGVVNVTVKAFHKELRREQLLGQAETETGGRFEIRYHPEVQRLDLQVRAYDEAGEVIAASPWILGAVQEQRVEIVVGNEAYRGLSEFERVSAELEPFLNEQDVDVADLKQEDIPYVAARTGISSERLDFFIRGAQLEKKTGIQAGIFYGLFRQDMPTSLPALLAQDPSIKRRSVETAIRDNIIASEYEESLDQVMATFENLIVDHALEKPEIPDSNSLGELLEEANLSDHLQRMFMERYVQHNGAIEEFWQTLREDPAFGDETVGQIQFTLQLGALTQNHVPLVTKLKQKGEVKSLRDMTLFDQNDLEELIRQENVGVPPAVPGEDDTEKIANYSLIMVRMLEDAFPTPFFTHRLIAEEIPFGDEVLHFFQQNPDFEFRRTSIDRYLKLKEDALEGTEAVDEVINQLRVMQRLFNIAPRYDKHSIIHTLMTDGLTSAFAISNMGRAAFMEANTDKMDADHARQVYNLAGQAAGITQTLICRHNPTLNSINPHVIGDQMAVLDSVNPHVIGDQMTVLDDNAEYRNLFGSLDYCVCKHCRSVYSPAAYLTDMLHFLNRRKTRNGSDGESALDVLFERRGDIGRIELNCENTNVVLPYIDLVNEVLEDAVANNDRTLQTEGNQEHLRVQPEHLNAAAYDKLASEPVYPWTLPFDLWAEELRTFLSHLGVSRHELMYSFPAANSTISAVDIAGEKLGLTPFERRIITGDSGRPLYEFWGLDEDQDDWEAMLDQESGVPVSELMARSNLRYEELVELIATRYLNPTGKSYIHPHPDCNLDEAKLIIDNSGSDGPGIEFFFDRLHRFVRLQRKLSWSAGELDAALTTLAPHDLTDDLLIRLADVKGLNEKYDAPLISILTWWGTIDTTPRDGRRSLYERLFLDPTVLSPESNQDDGDIEAGPGFDLNDERSELADADRPIRDGADVIRAAIEIDSEEFDLLITREQELERFTDGEHEGDPILNLANLSVLYRNVSLARALNLSVRDLLSLRDLTGIDPFPAGETAPTVAFLEKALQVRRAGFSIAELDYLLRHRYVPSAAVAPTNEEIGRVLGRLRMELKKLADEYRFESDADGQRTSAILEMVLTESKAERVVAILDGSSTETEEDQRTLVRDSLAAYLDGVDPDDAESALVGTEGSDGPSMDDPAERFNFVLEPLLTHLRRSNSVRLVKRHLADALDLEVDVTELLLDTLVPSRRKSGEPAVNDFLTLMTLSSINGDKDENGPENTNILPFDPEDTKIRAAFEQFRRLEKIATVIKKFALLTSELRRLFNGENSNGTVWLDLNRLPVTPEEADEIKENGDDHDLFNEWSRVAAVIRMRNDLPKRDPNLFKLLSEFPAQGTPDEEVRAKIADLTGWNPADIKHLLDADSAPDPVARFEALKRSFDLLRRLGVSAEEAAAWNTPEATVDQARSVRQAVKAKYEEKQWLAIAEPLRDGLREHQRTALVDYLVHRMGDNILTAGDLLGHFLIDVEMSSCMLTSRIVQANSSVQLFLQRCLMNLENEVSLTPADSREWAWMKNYRVWEANRKVFLYAENWIEPELRHDKSPFFEDLENELLQDEVTEDTAERAFLNYLEKLDEVARLDIAGMYEHKEEDQTILHVFGRTHATPHMYYYRRWVDESYWTPWEKVDADIEGDHLIPVVYNRRLYLFWPIFMEKVDVIRFRQPYYELQMAWSEYRNGQWSPRKISRNFRLENPGLPGSNTPINLPFKSDILFWAETNGGDLIIHSSLRDYQEDSYNSLVFNGTDMKEANMIPVLWIPLPDQTSDYMRSIIPMNNDKFINDDQGLKVIDQGLKVISEGTTVADDPGNPQWYALAPNTIRRAELLKGPLPSWPVSILFPHQYRPFKSQGPFFYQDDRRTFFILPKGGKFNWSAIGPILDDRHDDRHIGDGFRLDLTTGIPEQYRNELFPIDVLPPGWGTVLPPGMNPLDPVINPVIDGGIDIIAGSAGIFKHRFEYDTSAHGMERGVNEGSSGDNHVMHSMMLVNAADASRTESGSVLFNRYLVGKRYRFETFYHPYSDLFVRQLNRYGIEGLLDPLQDGDASELRRQQIKDDLFKNIYKPNETYVLTPYPEEKIDFTPEGSYSLYNWELFFHVPFLIANRLSANGRFDEAQKWYHYIFDPTDVSGDDVPARFWKIKPFYDDPSGASIGELMLLLAGEGGGDLQESLEKQIAQWRKHPFQPHAIARLRQVAYQKAVVMKYLDNLIAWGDHLFRQDTLESVNEATQLYVLAAQILGRKPTIIPANEGVKKAKDKTGEEIEVRTFKDLLQLNPDDFSNVAVNIETLLRPVNGTGGVAGESNPSILIGPSFFFCIPPNDRLLSFWDTVADRLFKIRHCMDIEGVVRQLPLFQPPIDPGMLVRAAAAGVDIGSALSDLNAPLPHYRFQVMMQKSSEFCGEVKSLGAALLAALEKKDAEDIALLRSGHEVQLLKAAREVRQQQVEEAREAVAALKKSLEVAEHRKKYYESRPYKNASENVYVAKLEEAHKHQDVAQNAELFSKWLALYPNVTLGTSPGPVVTYDIGGIHLAAAARGYSSYRSKEAQKDNQAATMASITGGYDRRRDDWVYQAEQAGVDIEQIDKQILGAEIRLAMTEHELANHDLQVENARETDALLRDKFTNRELYGWMVSQLYVVFHQSYQLAYDLAKRAERSFRHELGRDSASFIQFGYWDSAKKGLLAGEKLHHDLRRMDAAYMEHNRREFELRKHVSLAMLDPVALLMLQEKGECFVEIPEALFDLDFPGHYMRRIKSVSLSIPSVTGPYTNVSCTLTLMKSSIRTSGELTGQKDYLRDFNGQDSRFKDRFGPAEAVALSNGQQDPGLFELNLRDERYLPFEGAGAISRWRLELPKTFRQFDYNTISDVIFHVQYTARDGGGNLRNAAIDSLKVAVNELAGTDEQSGLVQLFSLRHDFPSEWHRFVSADDEFRATVKKEHFPYFVQGEKIIIKKVELYSIQEGQMSPGVSGVVNEESLTESLSNENEFEITLSKADLPKEKQDTQVFLLFKYTID